MPKFVPKVEEVEARQFDLSKAKDPRVAVPAEGRTVVKVQLKTGELVGDGDYLVKTKDGEHVVAKDDFEALYKPKG